MSEYGMLFYSLKQQKTEIWDWVIVSIWQETVYCGMNPVQLSGIYFGVKM